MAANDTTNETSTRWLGECQICEKEHKLADAASMGDLVLVHHGYRRPGHGSIVGDCPGVGYLAYEQSCARLKDYRTNLEFRLAGARGRIVVLREGGAERVSRMWRQPDGRQKLETLEKHAADPVEWAQAVRHSISCLESEVRQLEGEIRRVEARVARWAVKPLRSVEEAIRHEDGQRAIRAAARAEARAARETKAAATRARQQALAERRAAVKRGFVFRIREIAASGEPLSERQEAARRVGVELRKTKYDPWLTPYDLDVDQELVALGMANVVGTKPNGKPYVRYAYPFGS